MNGLKKFRRKLEAIFFLAGCGRRGFSSLRKELGLGEVIRSRQAEGSSSGGVVTLTLQELFYDTWYDAEGVF